VEPRGLCREPPTGDGARFVPAELRLRGACGEAGEVHAAQPVLGDNIAGS
jgi:hypothetical protein